MPALVGINGFGRIGRLVFRILAKDPAFRVVAVNDIGAPEVNAHLLKYDSTHGRYAGDVRLDGRSLVVDGRKVEVLQEKDPTKLPWKSLGVEYVVEGTGKFTSKEQCGLHLQAGAKKVLLTAPSKDEVDAMIVMGVNHDTLAPSHRIVSNASCTTNCVAPLAKVLHELGGIESGFMTTIHAYTNDQVILDFPHKDLRRARAAAINLIPTSTGAAKAIGLVLPDLQGKVDGIAVRAPVATGSLTDLVVRLGRDTSVDEVNDAYRAAAAGPLEGILQYVEDPIVSTDINGNPYSCIFDSELTMVRGNLVKVFGWYDNEWGYSCRCVDLVAKLMP